MPDMSSEVLHMKCDVMCLKYEKGILISRSSTNFTAVQYVKKAFAEICVLQQYSNSKNWSKTKQLVKKIVSFSVFIKFFQMIFFYNRYQVKILTKSFGIIFFGLKEVPKTKKCMNMTVHFSGSATS